MQSNSLPKFKCYFILVVDNWYNTIVWERPIQISCSKMIFFSSGWKSVNLVVELFYENSHSVAAIVGTLWLKDNERIRSAT